MFATSFPDLRWLKEQTANSFHGARTSKLVPQGTGWPTVVLNVKASNIYRDNISGPLSFFSNWTGQSRVSVDGRTFSIPADCFLITNERQQYTLQIGETKAETFNIHFGEEWTRDAISSLSRDHHKLIDAHTGTGQGLLFRNKLVQKSPAILQTLRALQHHGNGEMMHREELLFDLLRDLVNQAQEDIRAEEHVNAVRASTRHEILRRLSLATDAIYSSHDETLSLDELASISMMSKFHLLRAFKEVFHKTPYQFITEVKIGKARTMLRDSSIEVAEVSRRLGFDSPSTFSRRFKNVTGRYPSQYRLEN